MSKKIIQASFSDTDESLPVVYRESIGYDADGNVVYDSVSRNRRRNGSGFVISYSSKMIEFIARVSTGSIVRVFLYLAHRQSFGQDGQFGLRCSHKHLEQALRLDRTTVWDALKFLKDKGLVVENRVDGCVEFMVNPSYVTVGADKKLREREWIRRHGGAVITSIPQPTAQIPRPRRRAAVECDVN